MKLEVDFVERDDCDYIQDDTAKDEMAKASDNKDTSNNSVGTMMSSILSETQQMHTTIVDELDGPLNFNKIQCELQKKGITTQLAAEQRMCEMIHRPNGTTRRKNRLSKLAKLITYPQSQFRRTINSNCSKEEGREHLKQLEFLFERNGAAASQKPSEEGGDRKKLGFSFARNGAAASQKPSEEFVGGEHLKQLGFLFVGNRAAASQKPSEEFAGEDWKKPGLPFARNGAAASQKPSGELVSEDLKQLGFLFVGNRAAASQKPIYRRKSKSDETWSSRRKSKVEEKRTNEDNPMKRRGSSDWMLEESAVRDLWDK